MGPGSWVIVAIVVLQLVAGAVAKASEARKAKGKTGDKKKGLDSLLSKIVEASKGEEGKSSGARNQVGDQVGDPLGNRKDALEKLRKKRIAALRDRQASATRVAPPTTSEQPPVPEFIVTEVVAEPVPSKTPPPPAATPTPDRPASPRQAEPSRGQSGRRSKRGASQARQSAGRSKGQSRQARKATTKKSTAAYRREQSPIFDSAIAKSGLGQSPEEAESASAASSGTLSGLVNDPAQFRQAFIFAELLKPPVSLRPGGSGGLES